MTNSLPKGIRQTAAGTWQVYVRVHGQLKSRTFPADTSLSVLTEHREHLRAEAKYGIAPPSEHGPTFRDEARAYLALVKAMPTYADRAYRIERWIDAFGARPRSSITARDIRAQLERWRLVGRHDGKSLTPASLNQRRTALMAMYTMLDGRSASNIVRDVPAYDERYSAQIRAESMLTCARLVRRLRVNGKMRAVLHALLWTGWPHQLFSELTLADVDWQAGRVRVGRRRKGKGMPPAWVPVVPRALLALRQVDRCGAWGGCSTSSLHSAMARAVAAENRWRAERNASAGEPVWPLIAVPFGPYGLRHSFATWAAGRIKDDRALKELLRTNSIRRYTEGALAERLESARDQLLTPKRPKPKAVPFRQRA